MLTNEQIKERQSFIGGSDAGAVLGISPFMTPLECYKSKVDGETFVSVDNERLLWGSLSEPMIAEEFGRRLDMTVEPPDKALREINYSYLGGNPDRFIYAKNGQTEAHKKGVGILEIKTAHPFAFDKWPENDEGNTDVPDHYYAQLQHYLMITGLEWGYFAILVGNEFMVTIPYDRDHAFIDILKKVEIDFWKDHIQTQTPPEPTESDDLSTIYKRARAGSAITATAESVTTHGDLADLKAYIKELEEKKVLYENRLKLFMGENERIERNGANLITWKNVVSNKFDVKLFKESHPQLYAKFLNSNQTRRFLVK